jgi:hypothetical protein
MLRPKELLSMAEALATRIPYESAFAEEREVSWELIGRGWLGADQPERAARALGGLPVGPAQAALRMSFMAWLSAHPNSDVGRRILQQTLDNLAALEAWFSRRDLSELTPVACKVCGAEAVRRAAGCLEDPFTRVCMLATLASLLPEADACSTLAEAETFALTVGEGDRDWALRWVLRAHQRAGRASDAERVRSAMTRDPDTMDAPVHLAEELLKTLGAKTNAHELEQDSHLQKLVRFLGYAHNDLKVRWLVDEASRGTLVDPDTEAMLASPQFTRVEAARQPSVHSDPSHLAASEFADFFFARSVVHLDCEKELVSGDVRYDSGQVDPVAMVRRATDLFSSFGATGKRYSADQVEQGLWYLLSYPHGLFSDVLTDDLVSEQLRLSCLASMLRPFTDYYQYMSRTYEGTIFFMWWDLGSIFSRGQSREAVRDCLGQILALPDKGSQDAALHGLNHMHPDEKAAAIIQRYLDRPPRLLSLDETQWIEACRDGLAP